MARKAAPLPPVAALRMERLALWVIGRVEGFPGKHRFTVGEKWIETCLDIQTYLEENRSYSSMQEPMS